MPPVLQEQDQETRDRILHAAALSMQMHGTAGARMQEIADRAGVNKALLHYYFRNKEQLAEAVFQRAARPFLPPLLKELASETPIAEKVRRVIAMYIALLEEAPSLPAYMISEMHFHPERLSELMQRMSGTDPEQLAPMILGRLGPQIDAEVEAGRMRPIDPRQFLINLISLCIFPFAARPMVTLMVGDGEAGFQEMINQRKTDLPDFFMKALRP
jgi:AcrR family transcriptional regulator